MGISVCQVVSRVPSGSRSLCARLLNWWVCSRATAAAASLSRVSRSPLSCRPASSRLERGKAASSPRPPIWPRVPRSRAGRRLPSPRLASRAGLIVAWLGSRVAIRRSRLALKSCCPGAPCSSPDSRKPPLCSRACARPRGSASWRASGRPASRLSTAWRSPGGSPSAWSRPRRASNSAGSAAWRPCWVASWRFISRRSRRAEGGRNNSAWLAWTWALSRLPTGSGRADSRLSTRSASGLSSTRSSTR
ncbi:hypothetical protein D3C76_1099240 [compost metagenome]